MKFLMAFLALFVISLVAYMGLWMGVTAGHIYLAPFMMPVGLGLGGFFLMTLICLLGIIAVAICSYVRIHW